MKTSSNQNQPLFQGLNQQSSMLPDIQKSSRRGVNQVIDELGFEESTGILVLGEDNGKKQNYFSPYNDQFMNVHHSKNLLNKTKSPRELDFDQDSPLRDHIQPPPGPRAVHNAAGI